MPVSCSWSYFKDYAKAWKARIIIGRFWPVQENPRILYWLVLAGSVVKGLIFSVYFLLTFTSICSRCVFTVSTTTTKRRRFILCTLIIICLTKRKSIKEQILINSENRALFRKAHVAQYIHNHMYIINGML
jgi:transposase InsO family protein